MGGRWIIEEGDTARTVELMNPHAMGPEEISQTQGPLWVRKHTQVDLWGEKKKKVPLR